MTGCQESENDTRLHGQRVQVVRCSVLDIRYAYWDSPSDSMVAVLYTTLTARVGGVDHPELNVSSSVVAPSPEVGQRIASLKSDMGSDGTEALFRQSAGTRSESVAMGFLVRLSSSHQLVKALAPCLGRDGEGFLCPSLVRGLNPPFRSWHGHLSVFNLAWFSHRPNQLLCLNHKSSRFKLGKCQDGNSMKSRNAITKFP
ncbi:hypothetical protein VTO42DRAFT_6215 [Malbranchea cinnamomea]